MKRTFSLLFLLLTVLTVVAQSNDNPSDRTPFKGYYYNKEYNIYVQLDAYGQALTVPGQAIFGELPGYLGDNQDGRKWLFTSAVQSNHKTITLEIINDYGSEDLTATFVLQRDGSFLLTQEKGSTMKIARNRKWQKLPAKLVFVKRGSDYERQLKSQEK